MKANAELVVVKGCAVALSLLAWTGPAGAQSPPDPATQACLEAYQATQELRLEGKLRRAREKAASCAQDTCPTAVRSGCTKWLRDLVDSQPSLVIVAREGDKDVTDVTVQLDGEPIEGALSGRPIEIDPGKHVIKLLRAGRAPVERAVVVVEGQKHRSIEIDLAPPKPPAPPAPPPPPPKRGAPIAGIVFGGLTVGFAGAFAVLAFSGARDLDRMRDTCGQTRTCRDEDIRAVKVKMIAGDTMLAAGILSAGAAVGLTIRHYTAASDAEPARAARVTWSIAPVGMGAALRVDF